MKKSGVMRVGGDQSKQDTELFFNGKPLKELESIKYRGFLLTRSGTWDKYLDTIIKRARSMIGRIWHFCSADDIPCKLKLDAIRTLVLSTLGYGQEIIDIFPTQIAKLDSLLARALRVALNQPRRSKTSAL